MKKKRYEAEQVVRILQEAEKAGTTIGDLCRRYEVSEATFEVTFGTHSAEGSRFVERIMTAAATCKQQQPNVTEYITQACIARLHDRPIPSLLPTSTEIGSRKIASVKWSR